MAEPTAYAPDGKPWRDMLYEEAGKRAPLLAEIERLATRLEALQLSANDERHARKSAEARVERLKAALREICDFPYVGAQASAKIWGIARATLAKEG